MKIKIFYILTILLLFSCGNNKQVKEVELVEEIQNEAIISNGTIEKRNEKFSYNPEQNLIDSNKFDLIFYNFNEFNIENEEIENYNGITIDVLLNASERLLEEKDVENLYKGDIEVIRNTIYARHGYIFKSKKMKFLFEELIDWYEPINDDVSNKLTDIEYKNIELLKRYEEFAEEFSISFAR